MRVKRLNTYVNARSCSDLGWRESLEVIGNNNPRQMNITPRAIKGYRIRLIGTEPKMKNPPLCGGFFCQGLQYFLYVIYYLCECEVILTYSRDVCAAKTAFGRFLFCVTILSCTKAYNLGRISSVGRLIFSQSLFYSKLFFLLGRWIGEMVLRSIGSKR